MFANVNFSPIYFFDIKQTLVVSTERSKNPLQISHPNASSEAEISCKRTHAQTVGELADRQAQMTKLIDTVHEF